MIVVEAEASVADIPRPMLLEPRQGESFRGFISRLAAHERCSPSDMRKWLGLPNAGRGDLSASPKVAQVLRVELRKLNEMGTDQPGHSTIAGIEVPSIWLSRRRIRICPVCFEGDMYHRRLWDLTILNVCPVHKLELNERCPSPSCNRIQYWGSEQVFGYCPCGIAIKSELKKAALNSCLGASVIYSRFGESFPDIKLGSEFYKLPIREFVELMSFLGRGVFFAKNKDATRLTSPSKKTMFRPDILDAGAEIMLAWPDAFYDLVKRIHRRLHESRNYYAFSRFQKAMDPPDDHPCGSILRSAYREFTILYGAAIGVSAKVDADWLRTIAPTGVVPTSIFDLTDRVEKNLDPAVAASIDFVGFDATDASVLDRIEAHRTESLKENMKRARYYAAQGREARIKQLAVRLEAYLEPHDRWLLDALIAGDLQLEDFI